MVICTNDAATLTITLSDGLRVAPVHVWHSDAQRQFSQESDRTPVGSSLTIALDADSIYSLTTTTGQHKGEPAHAIPAAQRFPLPYRDDFESYRPGQSPRYFTDQKGTFEVWDEPGHGKCLKQIVPRQGILWEYQAGIVKPYSVIGDQAWTDYALATDVRIVGGDVELGGRYGDQNKLSYRWVLAKDGSWRLQYQEKVLAAGSIHGFDAAVWHAMRIEFRGDTILGFIDGKSLARVRHTSRSAGMAYLASTYDGNMFDNVSLTREFQAP
jgi:galactosylceramidase